MSHSAKVSNPHIWSNSSRPEKFTGWVAYYWLSCTHLLQSKSTFDLTRNPRSLWAASAGRPSPSSSVIIEQGKKIVFLRPSVSASSSPSFHPSLRLRQSCLMSLSRLMPYWPLQTCSSRMLGPRDAPPAPLPSAPPPAPPWDFSYESWRVALGQAAVGQAGQQVEPIHRHRVRLSPWRWSEAREAAYCSSQGRSQHYPSSIWVEVHGNSALNSSFEVAFLTTLASPWRERRGACDRARFVGLGRRWSCSLYYYSFWYQRRVSVSQRVHYHVHLISLLMSKCASCLRFVRARASMKSY